MPGKLTRRDFVRNIAAASVAAAAADIFLGSVDAAEHAVSRSGSNSPSLAAPERGFLSLRPAGTWEEALLIGNGRMGGLVMSQPLDETVILSHERLFLPIHEPLPPVDTASHLDEIRRMMREGQYQAAADLVVALSQKEGYGGKRWTDPFIPACNLRVRISPDGEVGDYARTLDFASAVATVRWSDARGTFTRRAFLSRPDNALVMLVEGPGRGKLSGEFWLEQTPAADDGYWDGRGRMARGIRDAEAGADTEGLFYKSRFRLTEGGYVVGARVHPLGGYSEARDGRMFVRDADAVLLVARVEPLPRYAEDAVTSLRRDLNNLGGDFESLRKSSARAHGEIFRRAGLDLGGGADRALPSEVLVEHSHQGALPAALLEKQFDAGRYAILCSSGELPPNLQGVWTGTWGPPWSGDYTQNGNVQAAIASVLSSNMPECLQSYTGYMESLVEDGRTNAKRMYGARGNLVASRTSSHGLNNHFDRTWPMTFWVAGAGWASQFFYDHYLYTGDREFLRSHSIPYMKDAAAFYEDYLVLGDDGRYLFSPSYSPENNPRNNDSQACVNATMDIAVAKELLTNLVAACEELGVERDAVRRWRAMLRLMPDYQVNADGAVKEWTWPALEDNYAHRHCSHLYPLFNGVPDEIERDPRLLAAFRRAMDLRIAERRKEAGGGVMAFGLVQLGLAATSLRDREATTFILDRLARHYYYPNLATSHDPGNIFNTDLSGGLPAVLIKSLVHGQPGRVDLLPAVPEQMPSGRISGVLCRGQITVEDLSWKPDRLRAVLKSRIAQTVTVRLPRAIRSMEAAPGTTVKEIPGDAQSRTVTLPARKSVTLDIRLAA